MIVLASDFDDTLYFHDGRKLRQADIDAAKKFQECGNLFVLCTGRPAGMRETILDMSDHQLHFDYEIYSCGASILDSEGKILYEKPLSKEFVRYALENFPDANYMIHTKEGLVFTRKVERNEGRIASADEILDGTVYELSLDFHDPALAEVIAALKAQPEAVSYQNRHVIDFVNPEVSKAKGIEMIRKWTNADSTAAIGDSFNDIPMLEAADVSYTFDSSESDVKDAADHFADGLWEAVDDLLNKTS